MTLYKRDSIEVLNKYGIIAVPLSTHQGVLAVPKGPTVTTVTDAPVVPAAQISELERMPEHTPHIPSREEIVTALILDAAEYGYTINPADAQYLDDMFARAAAAIRNQDGGEWSERLYYLTPEDLNRVHRTGLLDTLVPDERVVPEPGSAHERLGLRHLKGRELSFVHTFGESRGGRDCAVAIAVDRTDAT